jgi:hypothetical protein
VTAALAGLDAAIGRAVARARPAAPAGPAPAPSPAIELQPVAAGRADAIPLQPRAGDEPLFTGDGPLDYVCARCHRVLCKGIAPGDLAGLVLRCACGATSRVLPLDAGQPREAGPAGAAARPAPRERS